MPMTKKESEYNSYFGSIGLDLDISNKAIRAIRTCQQFIPEDIEDVFFSNSIDGQGRVKAGDLWIFSGHFIVQVNEPGKSLRFNMGGKESIKFWALNATDYDFDEVNGNSKLSIEIERTTGPGIELKAAYNNCSSLKAVFIKHLANLGTGIIREAGDGPMMTFA